MEEKKITAGQMAAATPDVYLSPDEAATEMMTQYYSGLEKTVEQHLKLPIFKDHDFYIAVIQKKEKLLTLLGKPTLRHYMVGLLACPRPEFGVNVYKYHNKSNVIEELWLLSPKAVCKNLHENKLYLDDSERILLKYYYMKLTGELYRMMKKENNEKDDTPQLKSYRKD